MTPEKEDARARAACVSVFILIFVILPCTLAIGVIGQPIHVNGPATKFPPIPNHGVLRRNGLPQPAPVRVVNP